MTLTPDYKIGSNGLPILLNQYQTTRPHKSLKTDNKSQINQNQAIDKISKKLLNRRIQENANSFPVLANTSTSNDKVMKDIHNQTLKTNRHCFNNRR